MDIDAIRATKYAITIHNLTRCVVTWILHDDVEDKAAMWHQRKVFLNEKFYCRMRNRITIISAIKIKGNLANEEKGGTCR